MRDATFKRLLEQRLENGRRMKCTVEPFINGIRRSAIGGISEDGLTVWPACGVCLDIQGRDYDQAAAVNAVVNAGARARQGFKPPRHARSRR